MKRFQHRDLENELVRSYRGLTKEMMGCLKAAVATHDPNFIHSDRYGESDRRDVLDRCIALNKRVEGDKFDDSVFRK